MSKQLKLYTRNEMAKVMRANREDYEEKKAIEILNSLEHQVKALAKKGYSVSLIARLLKLSVRTVTMYLIEE